jgi:hypothetical protein
METELKDILVRLSADFLRLTGRKQGGVWAAAVGDARFLERVHAGQTFTVKTFDRAVMWFSENWPEGVEWPEGVARPDPRAEKSGAELAGTAGERQ